MFVEGGLYEIVSDNFAVYHTDGEFMCHLGPGITFVFLSYHKTDYGFCNGITVLLPMVGHQAYMNNYLCQWSDQEDPAFWSSFVRLLVKPQPTEESSESHE